MSEKKQSMRAQLFVDLAQALPLVASTTEQHAFAINWLCDKLDEANERIAKLEAHAAQNPIGETEHGDRVFGYEPELESEGA